MKLKELESYLQRVETFSEPKLHLEQYITTPHLAAGITFNINQIYDDIYQKSLCDLGIGTGMLSIASSFFEPDHILGIDIDSDALKICHKNINEFELNSLIDLINVDCKQLLNKDENYEKLINKFDTCIMNPPFGTKNQMSNDDEKKQGIDMQFLKLASKLSSYSIYSIHKSITRNYIKNLAKKWNLKFDVVCELKYNIPKIETRNRKLSYEAKEKDVQVDLLRFTHIF